MKQLFILLFALLALPACISHTEDISVGEMGDISATKIINTPSSATSGTLILYLSDEAVASFEMSRGSSVTRSKIEPLNNILCDIRATKIERLFAEDPRHEAEARAMGLHHWYVVEFDSEVALETTAKRLSEISEIERIQYNTKYTNPTVKATVVSAAATRSTEGPFNDPSLDRQWHYINSGNQTVGSVAGMDINVAEAWRYCTGDNSIVVAIIDEGVAYKHEDLKDNMWVNSGEIADNDIDDDNNGYVDDIHGFNFVENGPIKWSDHGTHVAGTVSATNNNGVGVCGIAGGDGSGNGVRLMSAQIFSGSSEGSGGVAATAKAFQYAANNGALIAQCSFGIDPNKKGAPANDTEYTQTLGAEYSAIQYFIGKKREGQVIDGGLVVFAAGNEEYPEAGYPGAYRDYISVTSFGPSGMPAYYTNFGPGTNIAAPGGDQMRSKSGGVLSTHPSGYAFMQGTSMACPHVSGVAALGLSYAKQLGKSFSLEEFKAMVLLSVNDINSYIATNEDYKKFVNNMGTGRIDAFKMLMNVEGVTCISVPRGKNNYQIDLTPYLVDGTLIYKPMDMTVSAEVATRLGIESEPRLFGNKFLITCNNLGTGIVEIQFVAGTTSAGNDAEKGGIVVTKRFALVVRDDFADNGGWL